MCLRSIERISSACVGRMLPKAGVAGGKTSQQHEHAAAAAEAAAAHKAGSPPGLPGGRVGEPGQGAGKGAQFCSQHALQQQAACRPSLQTQTRQKWTLNDTAPQLSSLQSLPFQLPGSASCILSMEC